METQSDYMNRRAREERAAAGRACDSKVRDLHLELAARYLAAAGQGAPRAPDRAMPAHPGLPSDFRILE